MAEASPTLLLKIIWMAHFALTSWAMMSSYLPNSYTFTHVGVLAFGFWAIVSKESLDALIMFLATLVFSIINDILIISIYEPRAHDRWEIRGIKDDYTNEYRWALGMSIVNLILTPVAIFLVYSMYRSRANGSEFNFGIPGMSGSGESSSHRPGRGSYDNIESAQDSHPGVYGRPPYPYQTAPPPPNYDNKSGPSQQPQQPPPQA